MPPNPQPNPPDVLAAMPTPPDNWRIISALYALADYADTKLGRDGLAKKIVRAHLNDANSPPAIRGERVEDITFDAVVRLKAAENQAGLGRAVILPPTDGTSGAGELRMSSAEGVPARSAGSPAPSPSIKVLTYAPVSVELDKENPRVVLEVARTTGAGQ